MLRLHKDVKHGHTPVPVQVLLPSFFQSPDDIPSLISPNTGCHHIGSSHSVLCPINMMVSTSLSSQFNFLHSGLSLPPHLPMFSNVVSQNLWCFLKSPHLLVLLNSSLIYSFLVRHSSIFKTIKCHVSHTQGKSILTYMVHSIQYLLYVFSSQEFLIQLFFL